MAKRWICYPGIMWLLATAGALVAPACRAADGWSGFVAVASDYIYRGASQSRGQPVAQTGIQFRSPQGWSAGIWGSSADFGGGQAVGYEIDLHLARSWALDEDWSARLGLTHYDYSAPSASPRLRYDWDELTAEWAYQQRITASVSFSPNTSAYSNGVAVRGRRALAYELAMVQPLAGPWFLDLGVGHHDVRELFGTGYWYWNAGLILNWRAVQLDLQHIRSDGTAARLFGERWRGARWAASLTWRF